MLCGLETKGKNNNLDPRVTFAGEHTAFGWTGNLLLYTNPL